MTQMFGDFTDKLSESQEYLSLAFSSSSVPLKQRWRTNGLSADFMADYLAIFSPSSEETTKLDPQAEVKKANSVLANELLENAMKFNDENSPRPISIKLQIDIPRLTFLTTNRVNPQAVKQFYAFTKELTDSDSRELYIRYLEKNASNESNSKSSMGLLTMMNDYLANLGWKFETLQKNPEVIAVTTTAKSIVSLPWLPKI
jgi:hypothetical protein